MNIALACTTANEERLYNLKQWLGLKTYADVYRLALAASFSQPDAAELVPEGSIESGKQVIKDSTLFGEDQKIYLGVLKMLHGLDEHTSVETITRYLRLHLNHGLELLHATLKNEPEAYDQLLYLLNEQNVYLPANGASSPTILIVPDLNLRACTIPLRLRIGQHEGQPLYFAYNNRNIYPNQHMAIVGKSGSGKTYFAYSLLSQIYRQSQQQVHFLFIDYKGLTANQLNSDQQRFQQQTNFQLIDFITEPFPINPIRTVRNASPKVEENNIRNFADILTDLSNLGEVQRNTLIDVLKRQLASVKDRLPTFESLADEVKSADRKVDKLTTVLDNLRGKFEDRQEFEKLLQTNTYLSVGGGLSDDARVGAVVLVLNLLFNQFCRLPDAEATDECAGVRYVILVDEAHVVFKNPKALGILDDMLRTLRSRGVGLILSSQTLGEFTRENLGANIATSFLFDNGSVKEQVAAKFLSLGSSQASQFRQDVYSLEKYCFITNLQELGGYALVHSQGLEI
jgi:DNA sulfur modification protein DndE